MAVMIGAVKVLKMRVYPLDAAMGNSPEATTVCVQPGTYPLYGEVDAYYWVMTGQINGRGFTKIGDGMFTMTQYDSPDGPEVTFPSPRFGPTQWAEFTAEPTCTDGDPDQRLVITELVVST